MSSIIPVIRIFLLPANEVCKGYVFTGVCLSTGGHVWLLPGGGGMCGCSWGGMCGFIRGACVVLFGGMHGFIWGACVVLFRGACVVLFRGCAWFYWGACVVLFRGVHGFIWGGVHGFIWGHAWFYLGGVCGFIQGPCMVLFGGCAWIFQFFSDTMKYGQWAGSTHPTGMHSCFYSVFLCFMFTIFSAAKQKES